VLKTEKANE